MTMEQARQHLMAHGIRPSVQRVVIMDYLMKHHTHPTADTIFTDLQPQLPTLSRTTVYNTLQLLESCHAVQALTIDSHTVHYDGVQEPHGHFMCRHCGRIEDITLDGSPLHHVALPAGYTAEHVQLNCTGVCASCQTKT